MVTLLLIGCLLTECSNAQQGASPETIAKYMDPVVEGKYLNDSAWVISVAGDTIRASAFESKWLLVDYWTAGCIPCIKEFPALDAYSQTIDTTKINIIMLNIDQKKKRWEKAYKKHLYRMPSFYSGTSPMNKLLAINYQLIDNENGTKSIITSTPQYVLIDPEGRIVDKDLPKPSSPDFKRIVRSYAEE
ncbi:MAG: TlpA disulfide reductase family protein [Bacteroidota bacterium]